MHYCCCFTSPLYWEEIIKGLQIFFFDFETALLLPLRFLVDFCIIFCSWLNHYYSVTTHHNLSVSVSRKITPYHLGGGLSRYVRGIFHIIWWIFSQFLTVFFFESNSNVKIDAILEVTWNRLCVTRFIMFFWDISQTKFIRIFSHQSIEEELIRKRCIWKWREVDETVGKIDFFWFGVFFSAHMLFRV